MSAWRVAVLELHALGGVARPEAFGCLNGRSMASQYGLIERAKREKRGEWKLTQRGRAYAVNALRPVDRYVAGGGRRWVPTWLHLLVDAQDAMRYRRAP